MTQARRYFWIIGASAGIGEALAMELAQRGHAVAVSARRADAVQKVCDSLKGTDHLAIACDATSREALESSTAAILAEWPRIDSMIFMAGVYQPAPVGHLDLETTRSIITVNLLGAIQAVEAILTYFKSSAHRGQIALCASVAGYRGLPQAQPYGATKAGLINYTESLRSELGDRIDVRLINPGFVKTRLTDKNTFSMPMMVTVEEAANSIADGLSSSSFEISFPWRFVVMMKMLRFLPSFLYFRLVRRMMSSGSLHS